MFQKLKNVYHLLTALAFQAVYGFPARKLKVIGITGTDGKTTTSSLIYHVLKTAGKKVSIITSVAADIGGKKLDTGFHVTTPDPQDVPRYMAQSVRNNDEYFVLEITSHALDQHRAAGVRFVVSGITNVTHEHLQYHKTLDEYVRVKASIASYSDKTLINADQKDVREKIQNAQPHAQFKTFGLNEKADYQLDITEKIGMHLEHYNKYNFLLAYAICHELGVMDEVFITACQSFAFPPGRMEVLYDKEFTIISDFAHTPNALAQALPAVIEKYKKRTRLIHVFGSAALRDDSKRPAMGEASGTYANIVILTEEDYRTEDPERIFSMLIEGLEKKGFSEVHPDTADIPNKRYMKIVNREQAIERAIAIAKPGDIVLITGKGQESSLCRGTTEYPYNERKVVEEALKKMGNK